MITFNKINEKESEIVIYGEIGQSYSDESKTALQFKNELDNLGQPEIISLRINSPGGSVFDGLAIHNMLKRSNSFVVAYIDGLAASAASFIAMAADKIVMPKNAYLMIHNAWSLAVGDKFEMEKVKNTLEKMDDSIIEIYKDKTGKEKKDIEKWMNEETWFDGVKALEYGFIDELENEVNLAACLCDLDDKFSNVPQNIKDVVESKQENRVDEPQPVSDDLIMQIERFKEIKLKLLGGNNNEG